MAVRHPWAGPDPTWITYRRAVFLRPVDPCGSLGPMVEETRPQAPTSLDDGPAARADGLPTGSSVSLVLALAVLSLSYFIGSAGPAKVAPEPGVEAPDTFTPADGQRVLVLGDSHSAGTFGQALDLLLRSHPGTDVVTVGNCGVSPDAYLEMKSAYCGSLVIDVDADQVEYKRRRRVIPQLPELLEAHDPELTVVALGANQIHTAFKRPEEAKEDIRRLAAHLEARGSRCVWIGPPFGSPKKKPVAKMNHLYEVLEEALPESCTLVDSRPESMPFLDYAQIAKRAKRRGDGRHFDSLGIVGKAAARRWALSVFEVLRPLLGGPDEDGPVPLTKRGVQLASAR